MQVWGCDQYGGRSGAIPDYTTAVDKMVRVKDIFIPIESNAKRYDAMNKGIFKDLTKHTDVILKNRMK